MRAGLGFELREILALRGALRRLAVVIGGGLLALRVYDGPCGAGGIKCEAHGLLGEIASVALIDRVAREAGRLHLGRAVAIPRNDGA